MRRTTDVHLFQAGVDINTVRVWLVHVSLGTTYRYAEVDLKMKKRALQTYIETVADARSESTPSWHRDADLMGSLTKSWAHEPTGIILAAPPVRPGIQSACAEPPV